MLGHLKIFVSLLDTKNRKGAYKIILLLFCLALMELAGVASLMPFLAILSQPEMLTSNTLYAYFLESNNGISEEEIIYFLGGFSSFIITFVALFRTFTHYQLNTFVEACRHDISSNILTKFSNLSYDKQVQIPRSKVTKTVLSELDQFVGQIFRPALLMVSYSMTVSLLVLFLLLFNFVATIILLTVFGGTYFLVYLASKKALGKMGNNVVEENNGRFNVVDDVMNGLKTIKIFQAEDYFANKFTAHSKKFTRTLALRQTFVQFPSDVIEIIAFGGAVIVVLIYISSSVETTARSASDLVPILGVYALSAYRLKVGAANIYQGISGLKFGGPILRNLFELKKLIENGDSTDLKAARDHQLTDETTGFEQLELQNVGFIYPNSETAVLENINLAIKTGEITGIIGPSGVGKSTLIELISGLHTHSKGNVVLNNSLQIDRSNYRNLIKLVSYVPQDVYIRNATLVENIAFGIEASKIDINWALECLKKAGAGDLWVDRDSDELLGDMGSKLSGGQRQRIGVARALYRQKANSHS